MKEYIEDQEISRNREYTEDTGIDTDSNDPEYSRNAPEGVNPDAYIPSHEDDDEIEDDIDDLENEDDEDLDQNFNNAIDEDDTEKNQPGEQNDTPRREEQTDIPIEFPDRGHEHDYKIPEADHNQGLDI